MTIPSCVQTIWSAYAESQGGVDDARFYEAFCLGDSASMADELGQLVVAGIKRATAGSVWSFEAEGKALPKPGALSVVMDSSQRPLCIIETTQVDIVPFAQVTAEFAVTEGEGDGSLEYWRQAHRSYFMRECKEAGRTFCEDMVIACEQFKVVYLSSSSA